VRKVTRDVHEDIRDHVRALTNTDGFKQSHRERKKVEMRFAHMKRILKLDRLRLRGLNRARGPAHRNRAEPEASCQTPLARAANYGIRLPSLDLCARRQIRNSRSGAPRKT